MKLFQDSANRKQGGRGAESGTKSEHGYKKVDLGHRVVNKTPGPISKNPITAQRTVNQGELLFDTPKGKQKKTDHIRSEVDFILGREGGRPSAMTIDLPNANSRKTSLNAIPSSYSVNKKSLGLQPAPHLASLQNIRGPKPSVFDTVDHYGLYTPSIDLVERHSSVSSTRLQHIRGPIVNKNMRM